MLFDILEEVDVVLKVQKETSEKVQSILNKAAEEIEEIMRQVEAVL